MYLTTQITFLLSAISIFLIWVNNNLMKTEDQLSRKITYKHSIDFYRTSGVHKSLMWKATQDMGRGKQTPVQIGFILQSSECFNRSKICQICSLIILLCLQRRSEFKVIEKAGARKISKETDIHVQEVKQAGLYHLFKWAFKQENSRMNLKFPDCGGIN